MSKYKAQINTQDVTIYSMENDDQVVRTYRRQEFYKIALLSGSGVIQYGKRSIKINGSVLLMSNPGTVCS